ncbi:MAG: hypothetical protein GHCLOJNM_00597 [bacterium]|nr:hypothetical protein [bacterium]
MEAHPIPHSGASEGYREGFRHEAIRVCLRVLAPLAVLKIFLLVLVIYSLRLFPLIFSEENYRANFHWPVSAPSEPSRMYRTWDSEHFIYLSEEGYHAGEPSVARFPLWPLCIRVGSFFFGGNHFHSALVLANLLSLLAFVALYHLIRARESEERASAALLVLIAFPGSLFYLFPYGESLFLFIAVVFFLLQERQFRLGAAVCAFLLPLAREAGIFIVLPIAHFLWERRGKGERLDWRDAALMGAPIAGLAAYFLWMHHATGDAFAGLRAQAKILSEAGVAPPLDPGAFVRALLGWKSLHEPHGSLLDRALFLLFLASLPFLWRRDRRFFLYALPLGVVPVISSGFVSFTRHLALAFPIFVLWGDWLSGQSRFAWRVLTAACLAAVQLLLLIRHVNFLWAG